MLNAYIYAHILIPETLSCKRAACILESKKYAVLYGPVGNVSRTSQK